MKFGLMYEIQIPEPHYEGIEQDSYKQVLAQVELGDQVGFDYFWTVEHHFLKEFSHCPRQKCSMGPSPRSPRGSASGMPWCFCPTGTTTRCGSPSAPPSWTS